MHGPQAGLDLLPTLDDELAEHHHLHAIRAHLLEPSCRAQPQRRRLSGPRQAERTSFPEQRCLEARAAKLSRVAVTTFAELTAPP